MRSRIRVSHDDDEDDDEGRMRLCGSAMSHLLSRASDIKAMFAVSAAIDGMLLGIDARLSISANSCWYDSALLVVVRLRRKQDVAI